MVAITNRNYLILVHSDLPRWVFRQTVSYLISMQTYERAKNNLLRNKRLKNGGADRDRTDDLRLAKPALSQLSYSPKLLRRGSLGFGGVVFFEGEQDRRGDKEREEGKAENIGAERIVQLVQRIYGDSVAAQADEIENNAAELHFFEEFFALSPGHN